MAPTPASSSSAAATTSVQVALRIRPSTSHDASSIPPRFQRAIIHASTATTVSVDPITSAVASSSGSAGGSATPASSVKKQYFTFDQVHGPSSTQYSVFTSTALPLVSRFLEGFNCTILAYGQTSSGKTFTMTGIDLDADPTDPNNGIGIIPRAVSTIFARARDLKTERGGAWNYSLKGSFIEIYNEELADLLAADEYGRRDVQIREDKYGHIIWDGLKEVNVKNPAEVMTLIRKGTSIRRTNETEMNAQSSRSHAIFSLTLTQKKYTGSSLPITRSSSPLPPTGRSPSRLARPGSMFSGPSSAASRASSPTMGRPSTPGFSTIRGGGASGLRPPSSLGGRLNDGKADTDNGDGDWTTIVSKFHFVDLAGSERLKRTAAQGERIKEGISINGGLLALGNVISALGDPARAKSHTASYVPYRDSKLTRLLQDSLGGNAHTLMIACVSPAEWNAGETVNTLKYANRARNIKNRAVVNEKEEGWEDMEWLQGMVTRLRKELKGIKEGGGSLAIEGSPSAPEPSVASGKVIAQMVELQNNYEDLREQFTQRTEELTRLRRELADRRNSTTSGSGKNKYEEIVGPVIEEYEKTITAMEAELSLNRAALRHTNELVEEKEEELSSLIERHSATELYVEELRNRAARLSEREASTEAYVRDLEEKVKQFDETNISSTESMTDLKRELAKYRDIESHSAKYVADLEARLARSDESIIGLQQTVESLEKECARRRTEVENLNSRLENLTKDGKRWRDDLTAREEKVKDLEAKMHEWEIKRREAADERARLGDIVGEVAKARQNLQLTVPPSNSNGSSPYDSPLSSAGPATPMESSMETQLVALQQTHSATLADLSSVTSKYRDALREIHDLSAQLQEAKVSSTASVPEPLSTTGTPIFTRRKQTRKASEPGKRPLFRQAASADSLHSRSLSQSQSLSQELSSARLRKNSSSSHESSHISNSPSDSESRPNLSFCMPSNGVINVLSSPEKSVSSLEKQIARLQEVLQERESEIALLEESLKEKDDLSLGVMKGRFGMLASESFVSAREELPGGSGRVTPVNEVLDPSLDLSPKTMGHFQALREGIAPEDAVRMDNGSATLEDDSLQRLNELMRSMAQKESSHRELVDDLNGQLSQVKKQYDELTALSRDQTHNMFAEMAALRGKHVDGLAKLEDVQGREAKLLDTLKQVETDYATTIDQLRSEHEDAMRNKEAEIDALVARLKEEHGASVNELRDQLAQASAALDQAHQDHTGAFGKLKSEHEDALKRQSEEVKELLERLEQEHREVMSKMVSEHETVLNQRVEDVSIARRRIQEVEESLESTKKDHADILEKTLADHAAALKRKDDDSSDTLHQTEEDYYDALTKLRRDHAEALERQASEAAITLERLKEEHAGQIRMAEIAKEGSLSESQSATESAMRELKDAHSLAISHKEANFAEDLARLKADHERALAKITEEHNLTVEKARSEHVASLAKLQESQNDVDRLTSLLEDNKALSAASEKQVREDNEASLLAVTEEHAATLEEISASHQDELNRLKETHQASLVEMTTKSAELQASLLQSHAANIENLKAQHDAAVKELEATLTMIHERELQGAKDETEQQRLALTKAYDEGVFSLKSSQESAISDTVAQFERERAALISGHTEELNGLKTAHDETEQQRLALAKAYDEEVFSLKSSQESAISNTVAQFERERATLISGHTEELNGLKTAHEVAIAEVNDRLEQQRVQMSKSHTEEIAKLKADHQAAITKAESTLIATQEKHLQMLEDARAQTEQRLSEEREQIKASLAETETQHSKERETLRKAHDLLAVELAAYKAAQEETQILHKNAVADRDSTVDSVQRELIDTRSERDKFEVEVSRLREELELTRSEQSKLLKEASKRESLAEELEKHRSVLAETQTNLRKVKDEKDTIEAEKIRQETLVNDLQARIARSPSPPKTTPERFSSRQNTIPPAKPPPPTPPPSVPTPPTPKASHTSSIQSIQSIQSSPPSATFSISSLKDFDSPATSVTPSLAHESITPSVDFKILQQAEQQTKLIGEQETMIKTLNKQLTHCEADLQTHMTLVSELEASLGDSEKNLRKARMHATELARERDMLNTQITSLRTELTDTQREVQSVRKSVVEEKESLEHRLDEERRAKERARAQLDSRVEELQKRKSKFVCL